MKLIVLIVLAVVLLVTWILWIIAGGGDSKKRVFMRIMDILFLASSLALIIFGTLYKKEYEYKQSVPEEYQELTEDELIEEGKKYDIVLDKGNETSESEEKESSDRKIKIKKTKD